MIVFTIFKLKKRAPAETLKGAILANRNRYVNSFFILSQISLKRMYYYKKNGERHFLSPFNLKFLILSVSYILYRKLKTCNLAGKGTLLKALLDRFRIAFVDSLFKSFCTENLIS